jgi:ABC-2 type transport system permease protein
MPKLLGRIWTLLVKEALVILRDRLTRQMLIAPPIVQLILFSAAATLEVKRVDLMVLNLDSGRHGQELISRIGASSQFHRLYFASDPKRMSQALDRREVLLILTIPADFSRKIASRQGAVIQAVYAGRRSNAAQVVDGYLFEIVSRYASEIGGSDGPGVTLSPRHLFNPNLDHLWTTIPSLVAILTLIMTLSFSALSIAREKEMGTFEQLLVTPLRPFEIVCGKLLPCMLIGVIDSHLIYAFGRLLFFVPFRGSYPVFLASSVIFSFSIVGFGLMISSLASTQQQGILGAFIFLVPAIALSGFAAPVENMPHWLERAMWLNPMRHAVIIFKGLFLKDMPLSLVLQNAWPLAAIGAVSLVLAGFTYNRRLE